MIYRLLTVLTLRQKLQKILLELHDFSTLVLEVS
jgi:hypothetical protein